MANHIPEIVISWPEDITKNNLAKIRGHQILGRSLPASVAQTMLEEVTSDAFILKPLEKLGFDLDIPCDATDKRGFTRDHFGSMCLTILSRILAYSTAPGVILYAEKVSKKEGIPAAIPILEAIKTRFSPLLGSEQPADLDPEIIVIEAEEFYNKAPLAQLIKEYPDPIELVEKWVTSRVIDYSERGFRQLIPAMLNGQVRFRTLYFASFKTSDPGSE